MNKSLCLIKTLFILTSIVLTTLRADVIFAKEKIIWPYICFKPVYICEDNQLVDGSGFHVLNLLWEQMPEFEHELIQMPVKRMLENAKQGNHQLFYGLYKTPEREAFIEFSLPCRLSVPKFLVIRKADLAKFGSGKTVSLQHLLEDDSLTFLYFQSISFGKGIDELLQKHHDGANVLTEYDTVDLIGKSLKMLLTNRVDYFLSLDGTRYDAKALGVGDEIAYLSIIEQDRYDVGHIAAPKNEWGRAIIHQVDAILRQAIPTESFFEYFTPLVDKTMLPKLRQQYNEKILSPAKETPGEK